ncbi:unnamed protein product, partial [Meganyctiphanes norvegica]
MDTLDETDFDPDLEDKQGSSGLRDIHTVKAIDGSSVNEFAEAANEWSTASDGGWGSGNLDHPRDMGQVTMLNHTAADDDVIRREIGGGGGTGEFSSAGVIGEGAMTPPPHLTPTSPPDFPHDNLEQNYDPGSSGNRDIHIVRAIEGSSSVHEFDEADNEWSTAADGGWGSGNLDQPRDMEKVTILNHTNPDDGDVIQREIGGGGGTGEFPSAGVIGEGAMTPPPHLTPASPPDFSQDNL